MEPYFVSMIKLIISCACFLAIVYGISYKNIPQGRARNSFLVVSLLSTFAFFYALNYYFIYLRNPWVFEIFAKGIWAAFIVSCAFLGIYHIRGNTQGNAGIINAKLIVLFACSSILPFLYYLLK